MSFMAVMIPTSLGTGEKMIEGRIIAFVRALVFPILSAIMWGVVAFMTGQLNNCLPPDEVVTGNPSSFRIASGRVGMKVLTHAGRPKAITQVMERHYKGRLIGIKTYYFGEVKMTPEHPVLTYRTERSGGPHGYRKGAMNPTLAWIKSKDVKEGDYVAYPVNRMLAPINDRGSYEAPVFDLAKFATPYHRTTETEILPLGGRMGRKCKRFIRLDEDFARFAGHYIAEGSASRVGGKIDARYGLHQSKNANFYAKLVERVFGIKPKVSTPKGHNVIAVGFSSVPIAEFLKEIFGDSANEKHIPEELMTMPVTWQSDMVNSMWQGDGHHSKNHFIYVTVSQRLAYQLRDVLLRMNILPSVSKRSNATSTYGGGDIYVISFLSTFQDFKRIKHRSPITRCGWIARNYALVQVKASNSYPYDGPVYNFSVDEDQSYTTKAFAVHNCDSSTGTCFANLVTGTTTNVINASSWDVLQYVFYGFTMIFIALEVGLVMNVGNTLIQDRRKKAMGPNLPVSSPSGVGN